MAAERPSFRFPRAMRLKQRRDFAEIRQQGQRLVNGCLIANWTILGPECQPRLGVVTGRKLGPAIVRSRARRLLRESFRLHQHDFREPVRVVLVARPSIVGKRLPDVERDFLAAMRRAKLLKASE